MPGSTPVSTVEIHFWLDFFKNFINLFSNCATRAWLIFEIKIAWTKATRPILVHHFDKVHSPCSLRSILPFIVVILHYISRFFITFFNSETQTIFQPSSVTFPKSFVWDLCFLRYLQLTFYREYQTHVFLLNFCNYVINMFVDDKCQWMFRYLSLLPFEDIDRGLGQSIVLTAF